MPKNKPIFKILNSRGNENERFLDECEQIEEVVMDFEEYSQYDEDDYIYHAQS